MVLGSGVVQRAVVGVQPIRTLRCPFILFWKGLWCPVLLGMGLLSGPKGQDRRAAYLHTSLPVHFVLERLVVSGFVGHGIAFGAKGTGCLCNLSAHVRAPSIPCSLGMCLLLSDPLQLSGTKTSIHLCGLCAHVWIGPFGMNSERMGPCVCPGQSGRNDVHPIYTRYPAGPGQGSRATTLASGQALGWPRGRGLLQLGLKGRQPL